MHEKVNPTMVELGRKARCLTQTDLAKKLGCEQSSVSKMEKGILAVSEQMLDDLSEVLGYPRDFFLQTGAAYTPGLKYRRARARLRAKEREMIDAKNNIIARVIGELLTAAELGNHDLPEMSLGRDGFATPEEAAQALREHWQMPRGPVQDLIRRVEKAGAIVVPCTYLSGDLDGVWYPFPDLPPIIFLNDDVPGDRMRFTLAHELGHIALHRRPTDSETIEEETNAFAAEFMMPEEDIRDHLYDLDLAKLANLKTYWKMSMASILMRAQDLETISYRQSRRLWMKMGKAGYRKREPAEVDVPKGEPVLFKKLIDLHLNELQYSVEELSAAVHLSEEDFRSDCYKPSQKTPIYRLHV